MIKVISARFECPSMSNPIFGNSVPVPYEVDGDSIKFTLSGNLPINYGKVKIIYMKEPADDTARD